MCVSVSALLVSLSITVMYKVVFVLIMKKMCPEIEVSI